MYKLKVYYIKQYKTNNECGCNFCSHIKCHSKISTPNKQCQCWYMVIMTMILKLVTKHYMQYILGLWVKLQTGKHKEFWLLQQLLINFENVILGSDRVFKPTALNMELKDSLSRVLCNMVGTSMQGMCWMNNAICYKMSSNVPIACLPARAGLGQSELE